MKQYIKIFSSSSDEVLTSEINTYLEQHNCKIVSTQLAMGGSGYYSYCKTILIVFEEIEEC